MITSERKDELRSQLNYHLTKALVNDSVQSNVSHDISKNEEEYHYLMGLDFYLDVYDCDI